MSASNSLALGLLFIGLIFQEEETAKSEEQYIPEIKTAWSEITKIEHLLCFFYSILKLLKYFPVGSSYKAFDLFSF